MNILYIAPYRLANDLGLESLNLLYNLCDTGHTIVSRCFFDGSPTIKDLSLFDIINQTENSTASKFDLLIQHLPIKNLSYTSKIQSNLIWPITQSIVPSIEQVDKYKFLSEKSIFLYDNNIDKFLLDNISIKNYITLISSINNKLYNKVNIGTFNIGIYKRYNKYYTVVDHNLEHHIQSLIVNFIRTIGKNHNNCLLLFMPYISQNILDKYNAYIKDSYKLFGINFSINKIIIIPIDYTIDNLLSAHNTGDIYINLKNSIQKELAKKFNHNIIYNDSEIKICWNKWNLQKNGTINYYEEINLNNSISCSQNINNIKEIIDTYV